MNLFLIVYVVIAFVGFESGKVLIRYFFKKELNKYYQAGFNNAASHIYNQVQKTGKIDLVLDGKKITLVKLKEKNGSNN